MGKKDTNHAFSLAKLAESGIAFRFAKQSLILSVVMVLLMAYRVNAQDRFEHGPDPFSLVFDEIPVNLVIDGAGTFSLDVIYTEDKMLYINVEDFFRITGIQCIANDNGNKLSGYLNGSDSRYFIDYREKEIIVGKRSFDAEQKLTRQSGALFIESSLFEDAFGMKMVFNFRALSIRLVSSFELPVVKQARLEKVRSKMVGTRNDQPVDTVIGRSYHLFKAGTLDWAFSSSQATDEGVHNLAGIAFGSELLFGEAYVAATYNDRYDFNERMIRYQWKWVDNSNKILRQALIGKLYTPAIAYLSTPVIGASVRNTPATMRKASGYYTISDVTEPDWTVELYINDILAGFTRADAAGQYMFRIPLVYGNTSVKLRFYSPAGEEKTEERTIFMPYTLLPKGELEYNLTGGFLEDSAGSIYGRAEINYGINRMITAGAGCEYLSSIPGNPSIPFFNVTFQPTNSFLIKGEYDHGVRYRGLMDYYLNKGSLLELEYASYQKGQLATRFNAEKELKAKLFVPFRAGGFSGFGKIGVSRLDYGEFTYNTANIAFSAFYKQFSAGITAQANKIDRLAIFSTMDVMLSYRTKKSLMVRPSLRYNVSANQLMSYRGEVEKRFRKGYLTVAYERYTQYKSDYFTVGCKYDLPFARTGVSMSTNQGKVIMNENAQGSLAFGGDGYTYKSFNSSSGKGGILLSPFLDINGNGVFDKGEPKVLVPSVEVNGAQPVFDTHDTVIRIPNLNNFTEYRINFSDSDLENIAWHFSKKSYQVIVDPSQYRRIEVPVEVVAEMNGRINLDRNGTLTGYGRIIVKIFRRNSSTVVAETMSESDGSVYYLGLRPGNYYACIDSVQMHRLGLKAEPACLEFSINPSVEGDIVKNIDFILKEDSHINEGQDIHSQLKTNTPDSHMILKAHGRVNVQTLVENYRPDEYSSQVPEKFQTAEIKSSGFADMGNGSGLHSRKDDSIWKSMLNLPVLPN